jgi:hypothetical protein
MNEWVTVDANEINKEVKKDLFGVEVKVSFSPYDVPRRYRGYREPDSDFFVIEFQYITDEPTRSETPSKDSPIALEVGANSKRIYKIKLDVKKLGCQAVRLEIEPIARDVVGAIHKFRDTVPLKLQERYKMPENIVFNNRDRLFSTIAG